MGDISIEAIIKVLQKFAKRWNKIGMNVGISSSELVGLESDPSVEESLSHVIEKWWEKEQLTWDKVVNLLTELGEGELAAKLAEDTGMDVEAD